MTGDSINEQLAVLANNGEFNHHGVIVATAVISFLAGALSAVVYISNKKKIVKIEAKPEVCVSKQIRTLYVSRFGEKFHISPRCRGLAKATTTVAKTQCLVCCAEGLQTV